MDDVAGAHDQHALVAQGGEAAADLTLCVRLRVSSEHAKLSLGTKFGAEPNEVKALLFAARQAADALGICFHVGSQAMTPDAYAQAMERVRAAIVEAVAQLLKGDATTSGPGDTSMGGLLFWSRVSATSWQQAQRSDGATVICVFRITYKARITL